MKAYRTTAAALTALALLAGCSREQEEQIDEEFPVAAPAPELTAPADPLDTLSDTIDGDSIGAVP
jgi:hypothetical protein